jgi:hypothetical protein
MNLGQSARPYLSRADVPVGGWMKIPMLSAFAATENDAWHIAMRELV